MVVIRTIFTLAALVITVYYGLNTGFRGGSVALCLLWGVMAVVGAVAFAVDPPKKDVDHGH